MKLLALVTPPYIYYSDFLPRKGKLKRQIEVANLLKG